MATTWLPSNLFQIFSIRGNRMSKLRQPHHHNKLKHLTFHIIGIIFLFQVKYNHNEIGVHIGFMQISHF
jgi:hypothetical protein